MVSNREDAEFEKRAKDVFDESVAGLDGHTQSRLTRARHAALAELAVSRGQRLETLMRRWWLPAAGVATVALAAVLVMFNMNAGTGEPRFAAALVAEDIDLLSNPVDLELLEDMEFYAWLDSEAALGEDPQNALGTEPSRS